MYNLILSISLISLTACASMYPKTFYTLEKGTNLKIIDMQDSHYSATFYGNRNTTSKHNYYFARIGAIEHCYNNDKIAYFGSLLDRNKTFKKERKSYTVLFRCISQLSMFKDGLVLEDVSRDLVSPVTKDFQGGILVKSVRNGDNFNKNDVIIKINDMRVEKKLNLFQKFYTTPKLSPNVNVSVIRDYKIKKISVEIQDVTELIALARIFESLIICRKQNESNMIIPFCKIRSKDWLEKFPNLRKNKDTIDI